MKRESQTAYKNSNTIMNDKSIGDSSEDNDVINTSILPHHSKFKRVNVRDASRFIARPKKHQTIVIPAPSAANAKREKSEKESVVSAPTVKMDKLTLVVLLDDVSADERDTVNKRLQGWLKEKKFNRGSSKGKGFKNIFLRAFDDGFSIEIRVNPTRMQSAKQFMNFTFNPAHMTERRAKWFIMLFAKLFPGRALEIIRSLRLYRVDVCADFPVDVDSLIIRQRRGVIESKFFVATDAAGRAQTIYLGSIASEVHGVVYDQGASDEYKHQVGEPATLPPLEWSRPKSQNDAEVVINRTRFEVRRIFKDLPGMSALEEWTAPFDRWDVWQIKDVPKLRKDGGFWAYLDVVRWRGVAGARKYLTAHGSTEIDRFERLLSSFKTDWWTPEQFGFDVKVAFRNSQFWGMLRR